MRRLLHQGSVYRRAQALPSLEELWERALQGDDGDYMHGVAERNMDDVPSVARHSPSDPSVRPFLEELFLPQFEEVYETMEWRLEGGLERENCWRAVTLPHDVDPRQIDPLGIYWARHPEGANTYWDPSYVPDFTFLYRAKVNLSGVDIPETVRMNVINPDEYEVRFKKGAKIWVYDCEVWGGHKVDEHTVEINDWRVA